jgi:hypothetical protein
MRVDLRGRKSLRQVNQVLDPERMVLLHLTILGNRELPSEMTRVENSTRRFMGVLGACKQRRKINAEESLKLVKRARR